jgi:2-dehydropantoate 2-reductase
VRARGAEVSRPRAVHGEEHRFSSSWQSLQRGTGRIEVDYLNGEVVLLGRLYGVPTPVNAEVQRLANRIARDGAAPDPAAVAALLR